MLTCIWAVFVLQFNVFTMISSLICLFQPIITAYQWKQPRGTSTTDETYKRIAPRRWWACTNTQEFILYPENHSVCTDGQVWADYYTTALGQSTAFLAFTDKRLRPDVTLRESLVIEFSPKQLFVWRTRVSLYIVSWGWIDYWNTNSIIHLR